MKWMRERDLLIAQTMAFVQSVSGKKPEAEIFARPDVPAVSPTRLPDVEAMLSEAVPAPQRPKAVLPPRPVGPSEYRNEVQARVDKFRAHQAKLNQEREAFCSATMARMQATLDQHAPPRSK